MIELGTLLQLLNLLMIPALVYMVRIDRRLGQIDVITQDHGTRLREVENRVRQLEIRKERP